MSGTLNYFSYEFRFPVSEPPSWADKVERWYQLDAFAYGLPEAFTHWKATGVLRPELLILASPEGSNRTDFEFAQGFKKTGVGSPSKFVHTLPNSRSSALLQVMEWSGRFICIQNDPATFLSGLELAMDSLVQPGPSPSPVTWVLGVSAASAGVYRCHLFQFQPVENAGMFSWRRCEAAASKENSEATDGQLDGQFGDQLDDQLMEWTESASFNSEQVIRDRYVIQKSGRDGANAK
jgi:hypothetical protein